MLPFNRLIETMDDWARRHSETEIIAQIGEGTYEPKYMRWMRMVPNGDFLKFVSEAEIIVAHAGTGSVFSALEFGKPIVLVPRYADAREHTTDHQVHTANFLRGRQGVVICERGDSIDACIQEAAGKSTETGNFSKYAPPDFISRIRTALLD
jgi:UDP-N-acetylglucosamine transferase subunit ALG13